MKTILFLFIAILTVQYSHAQPPTYNDLLIYYVDGNYKKLAAKAEKYTLKEETKNDPYAYFWTAKALFKISFQNDKDEVFKNAYKESIGFLLKCQKKDKTHEVYEKEKDFFLEVKHSLIELVINEMTSKDYKKALEWNKKLIALFPEDLSSKLIDGACKYYLKDVPGATVIWNENQAFIEQMQSIESYSEKEKEYFRLSIIQTITCLKAVKQIDRAKNIAQKGTLWFKDDDYKQIISTL